MMNLEHGPENIRGRSIEGAFSKAESYLAIDNIEMKAFLEAEGFNREDVEIDIAKVEELKRKWGEKSADQGKKYATVFEALIHAGELNDWFGPDAHTIRPSEHDDFINGVDEILEFRPSEEEPSQLALAIDVTYGIGISDKLERIKEEIEEGKLTEVKYFFSEDSGETPKSLSKVPRVVVGSSIAMVDELADLWLRKESEELADHRVQLLILDEMLLQLDRFGEYAKELGKEDIAKSYEEAAEIIRAITRQKDKVKLRNDIMWVAEENPTLTAMRKQLDTTFPLAKAA